MNRRPVEPADLTDTCNDLDALMHFKVTRCTRCGRSEGLKEAKVLGDYVVIGCDCNYQHIRPLSGALQ